MCTIKHYDIMRKSKDKKFIRYQMVNHAKEYGIKPTARAFIQMLKLYESMASLSDIRKYWQETKGFDLS